MPPKREFTPKNKPALKKRIDDAHSALLIVESVFSSYFTKKEPIMRDIEHAIFSLRRVDERFKKKL